MTTKAITWRNIACGHDGRQVVGTRISFAGGYPPMTDGVRAPDRYKHIQTYINIYTTINKRTKTRAKTQQQKRWIRGRDPTTATHRCPSPSCGHSPPEGSGLTRRLPRSRRAGQHTGNWCIKKRLSILKNIHFLRCVRSRVVPNVTTSRKWRCFCSFPIPPPPLLLPHLPPLRPPSLPPTRTYIHPYIYMAQLSNTTTPVLLNRIHIY
jgi:hypothetical protein